MTLEEAKKIRACNGKGYSTVEFIQALQLTEPNSPIKEGLDINKETKTMIKEDYVSFETAKLLKEKGFNWNTDKQFNLDKIVGDYNITDRSRYPERYLDAPTLQMVMKWLRDVHNLIISVEFTIHGWLCDITKIFRDSNGFIVNINHGIGDDSLPYCDEYEDACEVAIKYCLENLI